MTLQVLTFLPGEWNSKRLRSTSTPAPVRLPRLTPPQYLPDYKSPAVLLSSTLTGHHYLQSSIMKFVALALTILFAAGSQARFLQADAPAPPPSQLDQVRAGVGVYLSQVKEAAVKALNHLDDTEFAAYKGRLSESLDQLQKYVVSASQTLAPYTNAASEQVMELTKAMREQIMTDVEALKTDLEPKRAALKAVLQKHIAQYSEKLQPLVQERIARHQVEMAELKKKMEPVVAELRELIKINVEETKLKLMPIVEAIRSKLTERLEEVRTMVTPYAEEYKEVLSQLNLQEGGQMKSIQEKVAPVMDDVKAKLIALWATINEAMVTTGPVHVERVA
ncbi:hypothetical protein AAFF_G00346060 [Aldrovandia affinis]|uniref:Apolipoprotein A-I n=1 Tax=Aldrovandia affinis TaxID=143900 RepID=A0AAD7WP12_9TELE|nr:hypothetical protein AAFF_G00346060 [Aldrovandia affinis]